MSKRSAERQSFLRTTDWAAADVLQIASDASPRRYFRLHKSKTKSAILMDAPPAENGDLSPFVNIARFLSNAGLSAPKIYAEDFSNGFLILEDLGDDLYARLLQYSPELETGIYKVAVDALIALQSEKPPNAISEPSAAELCALSSLVFEWYADQKPEGFAKELTCLLDDLSAHRVIALRDFHAENLIWLPDRSGPARSGLLDFQDAFIAHPAYDIVSLVEDARRDVSRETRRAVIEHFLTVTGFNPDAFFYAMAVCGAQRNLRILGVFARLAKRDGKPTYIDLIPRVWGHLLHDLSHPKLSRLAETLTGTLPEPTPQFLDGLRER